MRIEQCKNSKKNEILNLFKNTEKQEIKEVKRSVEEKRISRIEGRIYNWASLLFEMWKDHYLLTGEYIPEIDDYNHNRLDRAVKYLPKDLISNKKDLKYFMSKAFLKLGKLDNEFREELGVGFSYIENQYTVCNVIAKAIGYKKDLSKLAYLKPVLYREDESSYKEINIDDRLRDQLPARFFDNPTKFIEKLNVVDRDISGFGCSIGDFIGVPYDFTKIKKYKKLVFKRVDLTKVNYGVEEIDESQKIAKLLEELGDPRIKVQEFKGFIYDQGNIYLISKLIKAYNISDLLMGYGPFTDFSCSEGRDLGDKIKNYLKGVHVDIDDRNMLLELLSNKDYTDPDSVKVITIIDFETKK